MTSIRLSGGEISLLTRLLPRSGSREMVSYRSEQLKRALFDVRLRVARMMMAETANSDTESHILHILLELEAKNALNSHTLMKSLLESKRLNLTRLQAVTLASEAVYNGGKLDVYRFASSAGSTLEAMFSSQGMRERAELLHSRTSEMRSEDRRDMELKLVHLFRSHDVDGSGDLDFEEFSEFLRTVAGTLTGSEVQALWLVCDTDDSGRISFAEFSEFCTHNLEHLEREKKLKNRMSEKHRASIVLSASMELGKSSVEALLLHSFTAADPNQTGYLEYDVVVECIESALGGLRRMQVDLLVSEVDDLPLVDYYPLLSRIGQFLTNIVSGDPSLDSLSHEYSTAIHKITLQNAVNSLKNCLEDLNHSNDSMARRFILSKAMKKAQLFLSRCQRNWISVHLRMSSTVSITRLVEVVAYAFRLSMLRQLLVPLLPQSILEYLMEAFMREEEECFTVDHYLKTLESLVRLDLARGQLLGILLLSECVYLDVSSNELLIRRRPMAYFLSKQISQLHDPSYIKRRQIICLHGDEPRLLAGLLKEDLDDYISGCFNIPGSLLTVPQLREVLRNIPGLELSSEEVQMACSALRISCDSNKFDSNFLQSTTYAVLTEIKVEYAMHCRMPFAMLVSDEERLRASGLSSLKILAYKFVGSVVLQRADSQRVIICSPVASANANSKSTKVSGSEKAGAERMKNRKGSNSTAPYEFRRRIRVPVIDHDNSKYPLVQVDAVFRADEVSAVASSKLSLIFTPTEEPTVRSWESQLTAPRITLFDIEVAETFLDRVLGLYTFKLNDDNELELHTELGSIR